MRLRIEMENGVNIHLVYYSYGKYLNADDGKRCLATVRVDKLNMDEVLLKAIELVKDYEQHTDTVQTPSDERAA